MSTPIILKNLLDSAGAWVFRSLYENTHRLTLQQMMKRSRALARVYCLADRRRMKVIERNLRLVFKDSLSPGQRKQFIINNVTNFIFEAHMFFWMSQREPEAINDMVSVENPGYLLSEAEKGKGIIILTAHYGNWELLARKLCSMGLKVSVIARGSDRADTNEITNKIRNSGGYRVYDKNDSLAGIIRALRRGECFGILPDQHDYEGIQADFMGYPAMTPVGTAAFSLRTGAPIVPVFCRRVALGKYSMRVYPAIEYTPTGDEAEDRRNLTQLVNNAIENEIRLNPEGWLWMHDKWKEYFEQNPQ